MDFDDLRQQIDDQADFVLFDEVVRCIKAGAFRAAHVTAWIAAAEGMLGKFRTMAPLDRGIAGFVKTFEKAQADGTAKDVQITDKAYDFGLINPVERKQLDHLRDMRNQYGHPTANAPSRLEAEHALHVAVSCVLAKTALIRHGAAKEIALRALSDPGYLAPDEIAITAWMQSRAAVMHEEARALFVKTLLEGVEREMETPTGAPLAQRGSLMATEALTFWAESLKLPRWNIDLWQQDYPTASAAIFSHPSVWSLLDTEDAERIFARCLDEAIQKRFLGNPAWLLLRMDQLFGSDLLSTSQEHRFLEALESSEPWALLNAGISFDRLVGVILKLLSNNDFDLIGKGVVILRALSTSQLSSLAPTTQQEVGAALGVAATNNAWKAMNVLRDMKRSPEDWPLDMRIEAACSGIRGHNALLMSHKSTTLIVFGLALSDETSSITNALGKLISDGSRISISAGTTFPEIQELLDETPSGPALDALTAVLQKFESRFNEIYPN